MKINQNNCLLFKNLDDEEIEEILTKTNSKFSSYQKDSYIFYDGDFPENMYILVDGQVIVEKNDVNGKKLIMNSFDESGTMFGEVFIFLSDKNFEYSCMALKDSTVVEIPRNFLDQIKSQDKYYKTLTSNMLEILAGKAFHLNNKIIIHSSYSLRQKILNYIIQLNPESDTVDLGFNRKQLAEYIGTTRPSLSRELMKMEDDGLIKVDGNIVRLIDKKRIDELL